MWGIATSGGTLVGGTEPGETRYQVKDGTGEAVLMQGRRSVGGSESTEKRTSRLHT
jgi:hypothetical protein